VGYFTETPAAGGELSALSQAIAAKRVLPRLRQEAELPAEDPLARFRASPDGAQVEEIRMRYQVEWQLWAVLVKNFGDPAYHMAYISEAAVSGELGRAAERYREHRSVMALLPDTRWQADAADLMLSRVEAIHATRLASPAAGLFGSLPAWLLTLPLASGAFRWAWIALGLALGAKLLARMV